MNVDLGEIEGIAAMVKALSESRSRHAARKVDSRYDKVGLGFGLDERFSGWKGTLSLDSWTGSYGSSSCSTSVTVGPDNKVFGRYLVKALNVFLPKILDEVERLAKADVRAKRDEALAKLDAAKTTVLNMCDEEVAQEAPR